MSGSISRSYLKLKVIECDRHRGRVVLSERAAQSECGKRNALFKQLTPGICVPGLVTNVTEFGVFVDLGGVEGLIHVSELSWGRVRHPCDVVRVGDKVNVYVISIDPKRSRIALSLKRLCKNPWETVEETLFPGQITEAVITKHCTNLGHLPGLRTRRLRVQSPGPSRGNLPRRRWKPLAEFLLHIDTNMLSVFVLSPHSHLVPGVPWRSMGGREPARP